MQYIAFDAHKHYTVASVERATGCARSGWSTSGGLCGRSSRSGTGLPGGAGDDRELVLLRCGLRTHERPDRTTRAS